MTIKERASVALQSRKDAEEVKRSAAWKAMEQEFLLKLRVILDSPMLELSETDFTRYKAGVFLPSKQAVACAVEGLHFYAYRPKLDLLEVKLYLPDSEDTDDFATVQNLADIGAALELWGESEPAPQAIPSRRERPRLNMISPPDWNEYNAYLEAGGLMDYEEWHAGVDHAATLAEACQAAFDFIDNAAGRQHTEWEVRQMLNDALRAYKADKNGKRPATVAYAATLYKALYEYMQTEPATPEKQAKPEYWNVVKALCDYEDAKKSEADSDPFNVTDAEAQEMVNNRYEATPRYEEDENGGAA